MHNSGGAQKILKPYKEKNFMRTRKHQVVRVLFLFIVMAVGFTVGATAFPKQAKITGKAMSSILAPTNKCIRNQATCSFMVTGAYCYDLKCDYPVCTGLSTCCYVEWGFCLDDWNQTSFASICGGLCSSL